MLKKRYPKTGIITLMRDTKTLDSNTLKHIKNNKDKVSEGKPLPIYKFSESQNSHYELNLISEIVLDYLARQIKKGEVVKKKLNLIKNKVLEDFYPIVEKIKPHMYELCPVIASFSKLRDLERENKK